MAVETSFATSENTTKWRDPDIIYVRGHGRLETEQLNKRKRRERGFFAVFAPIGNESPTVNNEGVDRTATTIATETHVTVFSEAQSSVQRAMSLNLLRRSKNIRS